MIECNSWDRLGFTDHCKFNLDAHHSPTASQQFWIGESPVAHMSCGVHYGKLQEYDIASWKEGCIRIWFFRSHSNVRALKNAPAVSLGVVQLIEQKKERIALTHRIFRRTNFLFSPIQWFIEFCAYGDANRLYSRRPRRPPSAFYFHKFI